MAFMRIAVFDIENAPDDAMEIWDDLIGSALRNHPECQRVTASKHGNEYAVVSVWSGEDAYRQAMDSKPLQDVMTSVAARLGMAGADPTFRFEGEVEAES